MTARIVACLSDGLARPGRQFAGPPPALTDGVDLRNRLPHPKVLLIIQRPDGVFLERFSEKGSFGGDTWHQTVDEAKQQATAEYGSSVGEWREVPPEVVDPVPFGLSECE